MTGPLDSMAGCNIFELSVCSSTKALAKACMELSKNQQEFQRHRSKWHKGCSGAASAMASPQPLGVDVHTNLLVSETSYEILRDALHTGAAGPLRLKCREFTALAIVASEIVTLLESLDPSCLRTVELCYNCLELTGLLEILPHLLRFPELRSLKVQCNDVTVQHLTPESAVGIRCLAGQLGMLPSLRELNLKFSGLSGNLHQILCDIQAPLESLELPFCSLVPNDLTFVSQSFHAPALKRLDLSGHDISQGLLEPLRLLLQETSASLLHLNLMECRIADSHLAVLLPMLLCCSCLRFLGLSTNPLSLAAIKDLLQKTLELPDLHEVVYPYPRDCYKPGSPDSGWDFVKDEELFAAAKAEFSQILANSGRTDLVWIDDPDNHKALDYFFL
ncbi:Leucine-rich repeat-containing protein 14 [Turdus rufiventris]|nr:Leucine-rich repeat-containing protein 14 [Turdus rufiventris]